MNGLTTSNQLVTEHSNLVPRAAHHLLTRIPASVQWDDLLQAGMLGLVEAAQRFDPDKGASFATYADRRVRGAMLDEVRKNAWAPRSLHRKARELAAAVREVESNQADRANQVSREGVAREQEIADCMGVSNAEYHQVVAELHSQKLLSIEELGNEQSDSENFLVSNSPLPDDLADRQHRLEMLAIAIDKLPKREQLVLSLYYDEHLNLKEIGSVLGVTESRVSQLHSQALGRLKQKLNH